MKHVRILGTSELSALYKITPNDLGLGTVQSMASYIVNLAHHHSTRPSQILTKVLLPMTSISLDWTRDRNDYSYLLNGYTSVSQRMFDAVSAATSGSVDASMTCLPWRDVFDPQGKYLLHMRRLWCPLCYREQLRRSELCWDPVLWSLRPVELCVAHGTPLRHRCAQCGAEQRHVSRLPVLNVCGHCHSRLDLQAPPDRRFSRASDAVARWCTRACADLIASPIDFPDVPLDLFRLKLSALVQQHFSGSPTRFGRAIGIPVMQLSNYLRKRSRPAFVPFLDLCYRLDVPPREFLSSSLELTEPSTWRRPLRATYVYRTAKLSEQQREEVRRYLEAKLVKRKVSVYGLKQMSLDTGRSTTWLKNNFPELTGDILKEARALRATAKAERERMRISRLKAAEREAKKRGSSTSDRQLKKTRLCTPSDLRRRSGRASRPRVR